MTTFKKIEKQFGLAIAVCRFAEELPPEFWDSLSIEDLAAIFVQSDRNSLARQESYCRLMKVGDEAGTAETWLRINNLIKSPFKIKEEIARKICDLDLGFEGFRKLYAALKHKGVSLGVMILARLRDLAETGDQLQDVYRLYGSSAPRSLLYRMAEASDNLENWVFLYNHAAMDDELRRKAMQKIVELVRGYEDWLIVYKKIRHSSVQNEVKQEIIRLAGYDRRKWQVVLDMVGPKNPLGKLALQYLAA